MEGADRVSEIEAGEDAQDQAGQSRTGEPLAVVDSEERERRTCGCVVGIGASAGGLEALQCFFDNVPETSDLAFVVIQHLSPAHKSLMVDLLAKHTRMEVVQAGDGMPVLRDTVYLLPPAKTLSIENRRLRLTAKEPLSGISLPIDIFFTALARDLGPFAIGVVLSGTGSDGTRGMLAINAAGGFTAAQSPENAQFDGMPRSAIATGKVDVVAPADELPALLAAHARDLLAQTGTEVPPPTPAGAADALAQIVDAVRMATGVDFSHYKLATLLRRIERRMHAVALDRMEAYAALLRRSTAETLTLYKEMLIGVTRFFRDQAAFATLAERAVPAILAGHAAGEPLRIWVCGCATGEEAYSIAILFREAMERTGRHADVKVFATDIDRDSIEFAGNGEYPAVIAEDVSPERLAKFFVSRGDRYVVSRELRRMVVFAGHNIMRDPPFTKVDLISCRNLLIYMDTPLQRKVLSLFQYALRPGGYLFLGSSETLGELAPEFRTVDARGKIFETTRVSAHRLTRLLAPPVPALPRPDAGPPAQSDDSLAIDEAISTLLRAYVPPALLVNEQMNILHVFGDAGPLLRMPAGDATLSAVRLLPSSVGMVLGTALPRCLRSGEEFVLSQIPVKDRAGTSSITLRVIPFTTRRTSRRLALVLLEPATAAAPLADTATFDLTADAAERIRGLEQELLSRGENLQATVEELETANEELQATNEELLAANEELQSTNEELQSVNEELYSVNSEYQQKVEELTEITNDLDNLLRSTEIGTIFLDTNLEIRRFTPAAAGFINIIPRDVGRSIAHLSTNFAYPDFVADIRAVLQGQRRVERHVETLDGRWVQARILPYLSERHETAGAVVTFVDVTAAKHAEQRLQRVIDSLPEHIAVLDRDGRITMVNDSWMRFALSNGGAGDAACGPGADYLGVCTPGPCGATDDIGQRLQAILRGECDAFTIEYPCHSPSEERWFLMQAVRLKGGDGGAVVSHLDISARKAMEHSLERPRAGAAVRVAG